MLEYERDEQSTSGLCEQCGRGREGDASLLRRFNQSVVFPQHLLELRMGNGIDLEVVDALHGLGCDQGVDY